MKTTAIFFLALYYTLLLISLVLLILITIELYNNETYNINQLTNDFSLSFIIVLPQIITQILIYKYVRNKKIKIIK